MNTIYIRPSAEANVYSVGIPIRFSLAYARKYGVTDAILLYHLQVLACTPNATQEKNGRTWVYSYSLSSFLLDLPCFTNRQTVYDGLQRLGERDDIDTDYSGQLMGFIDTGYCVGMGRPPRANKTDSVGWYCVNNFVQLPTDLITVDADDIKEHGQLRACLLSKLPTGNEWRKLSATELAKELPFSRKAIQNELKEMLKDGLLARHDKQPKFYRRGDGRAKAVAPVQLTVRTLSIF